MDLAGSTVATGGFVDHHTHLLKDSAGIPFAWQGTTVRAFHEQVRRDGVTPMDVPEPAGPGLAAGSGPAAGEPVAELARRLLRGLSRAAQAGLTEVTEMGMRRWRYLDALAAIGQDHPLPARVRIYLASGLAEQSAAAELESRRSDCGPWVRLDGIKFYADGWLVPRTCAMCRSFEDEESDGILFADAPALARRIEPFATRGWRIATHAIGDRAVDTVLDAYELAWGHDRRAVAAARPRIEHGSILPAGLAERIAELGVHVCIQPSFPVTDAAQVPVALGAARAATAYPWAALAASGTPLLLGTDYPIEVIEPLVSLARLVRGRSDRPGFATPGTAPEHSRVSLGLAVQLATDESAGRTYLSADPLAGTAQDLDRIEVLGTKAYPFRTQET
jgi:predicted amidohydrolase YtcJ